MKNNTDFRNARQLIIIAAIIFAIMSIAKPASFLSIINIKSIVIQISDIGMITMGIAIAMITGGIDLSLVAMANLTAVVNAVLIKSFYTVDGNTNVYLLIMICFLISFMFGTAGGMLNGFLIADMKIPPILATLGTMNIFSGISMIITTGKGIIGFPDQLLFLGSGEIAGIPMPFLFYLASLLIIYMITHKTVFGLKLRFYGTNSIASLYSGIENRKLLYQTYIITGLLGSLSGILIMARTNSATVDYGSFIILYSLLAAVMGGVSPAGGRGNIINVVLALVVMQLLNSGLNLLRISSFIRETTPGFILILIMTGNYYLEKARERQLRKAVVNKQNGAAYE